MDPRDSLIRAASKFIDCPQTEAPSLLALAHEYNADPNPKKLDLGVGAYRTDSGQPWVLPVVKTIERQMLNDPALNHDSIPGLGLPDYTQACCKLLVGEDSKLFADNKIFGVRGLGGTGSMRLGADFLRMCSSRVVYVSCPTSSHHLSIFKYAGFEDIREYRYWNAEERCLDIDGLLDDLRAAPEGAVVVLHGAAHDPTGMDPSHDDWKLIQRVMQERRLFPFFDCAYQGFASGDTDKDAWAVRYFVSQGMELFCAQSFSSNFGLYDGRVGNLAVVVNDALVCNAIKSQLALIVRAMYSKPPAHAERIVTSVLTNPALLAEWKENLRVMSERLSTMRQLLFHKLKALGTPGSWAHIVQQIGMFSYTGLGPQQVKMLVKKYHIYLPESGRISMAGITTKNVDHVAMAIHDVVTTIEDDPSM